MIKVVDNGVVFFFEKREDLENAVFDAHRHSENSESKSRDYMTQYAHAVFSESGYTIKNRLTALETFERMQKAEQDLQNTLEDM